MPPLTRDTVTVASRIMLPAYPIIAGWKGLAYLLEDPARTASPSLETAKHLLPMRSWGLAFCAIAVMLLIGYAMQSRDVTIFVLYSASVACGLWAACFTVAIFTVHNAALDAPAWPILAACACIASAKSVAQREE